MLGRPLSTLKYLQALIPRPSSSVMSAPIEKALKIITGREPSTKDPSLPRTAGESIHAAWKDVVMASSDGPHLLLPPASKMLSVLDYRRGGGGDKTIHHAHRQNSSPSGSLMTHLSDWLRAGKQRLLGSATTRPRTLGKRICIVGVHGWFPTKMLQTVLGVPKGTSTRLCSMMQRATQDFLDRQPLAYFEAAPQITCVPLEGEGCIWERVDRHYAQLSTMEVTRNSGGDSQQDEPNRKLVRARDLVRDADSVIFVAHSQGAPVSVLLMERLLAEGVLRPKSGQSVALLTLAGVFHGPFPGLRENLVVKYVEADAARELFDLNRSQSPLSSSLQAALDVLLTNDVVLATVASWLDQVVPLHSSCLLGIDHPNIWRSLHVDAHNYRPDFLSKLVELALTMVNAQVPGGHQLLAQLGGVLAGSLYQSNAHSTLHGDDGPFAAILHWMYALPRPPSEASAHPVVSTLEQDIGSTVIQQGHYNPYLLPWIMRGLLGDRRMRADPLFATELAQLIRLHPAWQPDRRVWKELKLQLEPLSKL